MNPIVVIILLTLVLVIEIWLNYNFWRHIWILEWELQVKGQMLKRCCIWNIYTNYVYFLLFLNYLPWLNSMLLVKDLIEAFWLNTFILIYTRNKCIFIKKKLNTSCIKNNQWLVCISCVKMTGWRNWCD